MTDLCWVLTESVYPYNITAASDVWYTTWQLKPEDTIGKTPKVLDGPGADLAAGRMLMEQFEARGAASQRCTNVRSDGTLIKHTVSLVRAQGGLLAISTDMDTTEWEAERQSDGHPSLLDVSVNLTASMNAQRERRGAPAVTAADVAAAALDELEEQLDEIDTLKYNLRHAHGPAEAWGEEASSSRSEHEQLADEPPPAMDKAAMARAYQAKSQSAGQGSYDSTMTAFEAEMATADMP